MADEVKHDEEGCAMPPSKRKPESCLVESNEEDGQCKKSKTEIETTTNVADGEQEQPLAFKIQNDEAEEDEEEEHSNGEADRKGKDIVTRDDKGKGKMVDEDDGSSEDGIFGGGIGEVDDDDDDDDSSEDDDDDDSGDEDDSDLSDDPLTEVDLDNILPSRTRRRSAAPNPGICLGKGKDN